MAIQKCKHNYLEWISDGDKRLVCKKCSKKFVRVFMKYINVLNLSVNWNIRHVKMESDEQDSEDNKK